MDQRRNFFSAEASQEELVANANSSSAGDRWLAAIQLGQESEVWAAELLWKLKDDTDDSTRSAAIASLRNFKQEVLFEVGGGGISEGYETFIPTTWKVRPLPKLEVASRDLFSASIIDILGAEGPTSGTRIFRLISKAVSASGNSYPSRTQIRDLLVPLLESHAVTRVDKHFESQILEHWIINLVGYPEFIIRERGEREIDEIPLNEAQGVLKNDARFMRRPDPDMGWEVLKRQYDIHQNEFHKVGEALEGSWQGLFKLT
jgi:hypothetical protein